MACVAEFAGKALNQAVSPQAAVLKQPCFKQPSFKQPSFKQRRT
jgi:hypothetical protein